MEDDASSLYIDFGRLIEKKRPAHRMLAVEEVLATAIPLHEKIAAIERIDANRPPRSARRFVDEDDTGDIVDDCDEKLSPECQDRCAVENRSKIKVKLTRSSFFAFLFKELYKIVKAASKYSYLPVVKFSLLPFSLSVNAQMQQHLFVNYIKGAAELTGLLDYATENGWQHLSKLEYNLLVLFKDMCHKLSTLNAKIFISPNPMSSEKFRLFEQLFLSCVKDEFYAESIQQSLQKVAAKSSEWNSSISLKLVLVRKLLLRYLRPSLQDVVCAVNIAWFRRQLDFASLYNEIPLPVIPVNDFACTTEVRRAINDFLEQQKKRIIDLENEVSSVKLFEEHLSYMPDKSFDFSLLRHYFVLGNKGANFEEAEQYPPLFTLKMLNVFIGLFETICISEIHTDKKQRLRIFGAEVFQMEFSKIHGIFDKLNRLNYIHKNIDADRFKLLRGALNSGTSVEIEAMQLIAEAVETVLAIAEKMISVQKYNCAGEEKRVDAAMISMKKLTIPGLLEKLQHPQLQGLSVQQTLRDIVSVSLLSAIFLKDNRVSTLLSQHDKLTRDLDASKATFSRIAPASAAVEFYSTLGIEPPNSSQED